MNNIDVSGTVGILDNLQTEDKTNLVNSINELHGLLTTQRSETINLINDIIDNI